MAAAYLGGQMRALSCCECKPVPPRLPSVAKLDHEVACHRSKGWTTPLQRNPCHSSTRSNAIPASDSRASTSLPMSWDKLCIVMLHSHRQAWQHVRLHINLKSRIGNYSCKCLVQYRLPHGCGALSSRNKCAPQTAYFNLRESNADSGSNESISAQRALGTKERKISVSSGWLISGERKLRPQSSVLKTAD